MSMAPMAPRVCIPAVNLHAPPDVMSDAAASLAEPLACVTNSLYGDAPYIEPGDQVLVIGAGAIGLIAAQVAPRKVAKSPCGAPSGIGGDWISRKFWGSGSVRSETKCATTPSTS